MKRHFFLIITGLSLFFSNFAHLAAASEEEALVSAMSWITLVDEGKYRESWQEASSFFKKSVTEEKWVEAAKGVRAPLGGVVTRRLSSSKFHTSLPGVPDGQYVVITLSSSFDNKKKAVETITPMLDKDGVWRISGYFIK